jgi:hypothetical protein
MAVSRKIWESLEVLKYYPAFSCDQKGKAVLLQAWVAQTVPGI